MSQVILSFIIFLPAVVAIGLLLTTKEIKTVRNISFVTTTVVLALILKLFIDYEAYASMQFVVNIPWIESYGINYYLGLDGFSLTILMMIGILIPSAYLFLWEKENKAYFINMLLVQSGITGALLALDIILFYLFWELMLIPIFLMIGMYGSGEKVATTLKVTIYTMAGSLLMLIAIFYLGNAYFMEFGTWSFAYNDLTKITTIDASTKTWLFLAFLLAFAIKIPLFPVHTWIMATYKNAPTGAVFILSAIMAKLGAYALIRFLIPIFPEASIEYSNYLVFIGIFGMIYFGVAALTQNDVKRMFAYSSASHLSFIAAGIFTLTSYGLNGALYLIMAHAIATGALFLMVGNIYDQTGTKKIDQLGGIAKKAPILTFIFAIMLFSNVGLPGTSGFVAEFLIIFGVFEFNLYLGIFAALSVIIGASYMLWMFQRAILQDRKENQEELVIKDLKVKEIIAFIPFVILIFVMGFYPDIFTKIYEPTVIEYLNNIIGVAK